MLRPWLRVCSLASLLAACGEDPPPPDLPEAYRAAARIAGLTQSACGGAGALDSPPVRVDVTPEGGDLSVTLRHVRLRCEQAAHAFVRDDDGALSVLIQPADMDPRSVARCMCSYDLTFVLPGAVGTERVTFEQRADNIGGASEPLNIAMVQLDADGVEVCRPIYGTRLDLARGCSLEREQVGCYSDATTGCDEALGMARSPDGHVYWFADLCFPEGWEPYREGLSSSPPTSWQNACP
jgi:hypothetical protein